MRPPQNSRKALVWQTAVIILPVIILAALGAFYLRQDRLLVRHEAEEQARILAHEIAEKLWRGLTNSTGLAQEYAFRIDDDGTLVFPPPFDQAPAPRPLDVSRLTPEQIALWEQRPIDSTTLGRLLETELPPNFQAVASYRRAVTLAAENKLADAYDAFRVVYQKSPRALGEAGLPVALLAGLKALGLPTGLSDARWARPLSWDILCGLAIAEPSALTGSILHRAADAGALPASRINEYRAQWAAHETLRELYRASRKEFTSLASAPPLFGIHTAGDRWLASRVAESATNHWIVCRNIALHRGVELRASSAPLPAATPNTNLRQIGLGFRVGVNDVADIRAMRVGVGPDLKRVPGIGGAHLTPAPLAELLRSLGPVPDYLRIGIVAAGEPILPLTDAPVLATTTHAENGRDLLKVSLHLARPELLYARQKQRVLWFGLLIAVSTAAAIIGLISAWRSFEKQQRLAELKDNFVSSVSHELRAPIASVRLMAEGLERGRVQDPQKQHEYYRFIVQECRRLSALIQNVLDFARIDQGRKQYEFESADVLRLVDETVKAMEPAAAERQIALRFATPAETPLNAVIDARAIQQALVNLIDNAIKHSRAGSEILVGVAAQTTGPQPLLQISVQDHGEGIPAVEHERIFERFYRVGSELRRQTPGAGIGLSIVKHIVDAHDGRVRVESEPGKGSRFTIEIPLKG